MTMAEATMMGLIGGLLGVAVGALLAGILVHLSRTSGFEPEFVFSWEIAAVGIAVTVVASALAAIGPARRAGLVEIQ
jgi:putative ABC transport system permease protein